MNTTAELKAVAIIRNTLQLGLLFSDLQGELKDTLSLRDPNGDTQYADNIQELLWNLERDYAFILSNNRNIPETLDTCLQDIQAHARELQDALSADNWRASVTVAHIERIAKYIASRF